MPCHSLFLSLFLGFCLFLSTPAAAESFKACKNEAPAWRNCKTKADCVIVSNPCGWPSDTASKPFANQVLKCNQERGTVMGCPQYDAVRDGSYTAHCIVGKCVAVKDIP